MVKLYKILIDSTKEKSFRSDYDLSITEAKRIKKHIDMFWLMDYQSSRIVKQ